jgi:Exostosin family
VEIPFFSLFERPSHVDSYGQKGSVVQRNDLIEANLRTQLRPTVFFFSGRLLLWMPERICSVRHTVATQLSSRPDTVIVNVSESQSYGPVREGALRYLLNSTFCLVTRTDSYSTAFFYDALQAGCIPIVIRCVASYHTIPYHTIACLAAYIYFMKQKGSRHVCYCTLETLDLLFRIVPNIFPDLLQ